MHSPADQRQAWQARRDAAARAARAAAASRRAAAAKRRLVLTLSLLALTVLAWVLVGTGAISWLVAALPSALFVAVVVLGRRAAVLARAADARLVEEVRRARKADHARAARVAATTHAREGGEVKAKPSLRVEVDPAKLFVEAAGESAAAAVEGGSEWTPVPVPAPVYTMKPAAPRRLASAVSEEMASEEASAGVALSVEESTGNRVESGAETASVAQATEEVSLADSTPAVRPVSSVNLQEVLERRRAVGQ